MKLDQLEYFVATARRQHIGQAAIFLNISPSAISHSITALEQELGKKLFEKQGRQIKLTAHGKLLLDRAEFLLNETDRIREELSSDEITLRGHYRIAATHWLSSELLTPNWIAIQKENPGLTASLLSLKSSEVVAMAASGEIDLGICLSPHSGPNHEQEILHRGKLVFCFGKGHPFLKDKKVQDLNHYPALAAMASQGIENCENHPDFQKLNIKMKVENLFNSYEVAVKALKNNTMWTMLPDFIAYRYRGEIETFIPRGWDSDYKVAAIWPKFRIRTQTLDLVVAQVKASLQAAASKR